MYFSVNTSYKKNMKLEWKSCFRLGATVFLTFLAIHYWSSLTGLIGVLFSAARALII